MKKNIVFTFLSFLLFACTSTQILEIQVLPLENIFSINTIDEINNKDNSKILYYFLHTGNNDLSQSFSAIPYEDVSIKLFPGNYDIYTIVIIPKTENSVSVAYYNYENCTIDSEKMHSVTLIAVDSEIMWNRENNNINVSIDVCHLCPVFEISSFSVKQNTNRLRSVNLEYNPSEIKYSATIEIEEEGEWYYTLGFKYKGKLDENMLEGKTLSTTYYGSRLLGVVE